MNMERMALLLGVVLAAGCGGSGGQSRVGNAATNVAPNARDTTVEIDEDSGVYAGKMLATDANAGDTLFFGIAQEFISGGTLIYTGSGGAAGVARSDPDFTYEPRLNFNGTDSFVFNVNDGLASDQGTVTIVVRPVNDPPVAGDDIFVSEIDATLQLLVLDNDSDVDREDVIIVAVDAVTTEGGSAAANDAGTPDDPTDDFIDYVAPAGFNGLDTFTYAIADAAGLTNSAVVSVQLGPVAAANKLRVAVDLLPDACPNRLAETAVGEVSVVIAGSAATDVRAIDAASLRLAGIAPVRSMRADVSYLDLSAEFAQGCGVPTADGYDDLVLVFPASALVRGAARDATLVLSGRMDDGTPVTGADRLLVDR